MLGGTTGMGAKLNGWEWPRADRRLSAVQHDFRSFIHLGAERPHTTHCGHGRTLNSTVPRHHERPRQH